MELTILMPCLNEERTITSCIKKAQEFLINSGIEGEVLVADNGSTDNSIAIAKQLGARVVSIQQKGYGAALSGGIDQAQGKYVIFGDSDESYDFSDLEQFLDKLRTGVTLVVGNRFKGGIDPGAMPFLHRYLGNPVLSFIGRVLFRAPLGDFHCGLRGFDRDAIKALDLRTTGMEFASEMIIRAVMSGLSVSEVPTRLAKDGRDRPPHLNTWRDGWRHLIYMLIHSPQILFVWPGIGLFSVGLFLSMFLLGGPLSYSGVWFDINTLLFSAASVVGGLQLVYFGEIMQLAGQRFGFWKAARMDSLLLSHFKVEYGLVVGALAVVVGIYLATESLSYWRDNQYAAIDPSISMRLAIPAVMIGLAGLQTLVFSMAVGLIKTFGGKRG